MWCIVGTQQVIKYLLIELAHQVSVLVCFFILHVRNTSGNHGYTQLAQFQIKEQLTSFPLGSLGPLWRQMRLQEQELNPRPPHKATRRMSCPSNPSHVATLVGHGLMDSQLNNSNKTKGRCPYTLSLRSEVSVLSKSLSHVTSATVPTNTPFKCSCERWTSQFYNNACFENVNLFQYD